MLIWQPRTNTGQQLYLISQVAQPWQSVWRGIMGWEQWDIKHKDMDKVTNNLTKEGSGFKGNLLKVKQMGIIARYHFLDFSKQLSDGVWSSTRTRFCLFWTFPIQLFTPRRADFMKSQSCIHHLNSRGSRNTVCWLLTRRDSIKHYTNTSCFLWWLPAQ